MPPPAAAAAAIGAEANSLDGSTILIAETAVSDWTTSLVASLAVITSMRERALAVNASISADI